jgi:hypothetical protein
MTTLLNVKIIIINYFICYENDVHQPNHKTRGEEVGEHFTTNEEIQIKCKYQEATFHYISKYKTTEPRIIHLIEWKRTVVGIL